MAQAESPVRFAHPQANRELALGHAVVAYQFKRARRRTIVFQIRPEGLVISAPNWAPLYQVDAALLEKSVWIVRKLAEVHERHARHLDQRIDWRDGSCFPYMGNTVRVLLDPGHRFEGVGAHLASAAADDVTPEPVRTLRVALAHNASTEQVRDAVQAWLMGQARRLFIERLDHFAPQLQVRWQRLALSNAQTRWGSASSDGSIRLNWRLVHFKPAVIDYVVVHELSHLRVMDHSPRFWDTVRSVVPHYSDLRRQLKDQNAPRWD